MGLEREISHNQVHADRNKLHLQHGNVMQRLLMENTDQIHNPNILLLQSSRRPMPHWVRITLPRTQVLVLNYMTSRHQEQNH